MQIKNNQHTKLFDRLTLNWKPRFKILQGGSSSSKTISLLQYLILCAMYGKEKKLVSVVAETLPALRRGALRDFINILGDQYDDRQHNKSDGTYKLGKWTFEFFGADNAARLRGARRDILFCNEANNIRYDAYSQLEMRTNDQVFVDFNPVSEFWIHEEVIPKLKPEEYWFDISTYRDNQYAPPAAIAAIERRKYNGDGEISEFYKVYGLGQIGSLEGVVYDNWEQINEMPLQLQHQFGLDFGFTNDPTALVKVIYHNGAIYADEYLYETGLTNQDIAEKAKKLGITNKDLIYADSAEPKSIAELNREGLRVIATSKGKDSIRNGIDWVQSKRIYVTKRSTNLIKELRNYVWETDKSGNPTNVPIDAYNDLLDATRYALTRYITRNSTIAKKVIF